MYLFEQENEHKIRKSIVKCEDRNCNGLITSYTELDNWSPRIEGECDVCDMKVSIKLSNIEKDRIIDIEVIAYEEKYK